MSLHIYIFINIHIQSHIECVKIKEWHLSLCLIFQLFFNHLSSNYIIYSYRVDNLKIFLLAFYLEDQHGHMKIYGKQLIMPTCKLP